MDSLIVEVSHMHHVHCKLTNAQPNCLLSRFRDSIHIAQMHIPWHIQNPLRGVLLVWLV